MMKNQLVKWILQLAVVFAVASIPMTGLAGDKNPPADTVASVDEAAITRDAFDRTMVRVKKRLARSGRNPAPEDLSRIEKEVLEQLIGQKLIHLESRKKGFSVPATEVDAQLKKMKGQFPSDAEFKQALDRMGFLDTDLAPQIQERMEVQRFIDAEIASKIKIPDTDAKAFYDGNAGYFKKEGKVKASHILITVAPDAEKEKKEKARQDIEKILEKIKNGEDFAALAKSHSQGPSGASGGDLGFFGRGQMVKPFEDAAFALETGEISGVVETQFGYHIIKVFEKQPELITPYAEVKERIAQHLKSQEIRTQITKFVEELKKTASIQRHL